MALVQLGMETVSFLPAVGVLGAAVLLPAHMATALRLENADAREATPATSVDALLQRVFDGELDLGVDLDLDLARLRNLPVDSRDPDVQYGQTMRPPQGYDEDVEEEPQPRPGLDTWSVVWYCGMFAAFTSLFLIMPCSQVLCRAGLLNGDPRLRARAPLAALHTPAHGYGTPPPPYKQFAPPAYEDVVLDLDFVPPGKAVPVSELPQHLLQPEKDKEAAGRDTVLDVYVIPLRAECAAAASTQAAA